MSRAGAGFPMTTYRIRWRSVDVDALGKPHPGGVVLQTLLLGGAQQGRLPLRLLGKIKGYYEELRQWVIRQEDWFITRLCGRTVLSLHPKRISQKHNSLLTTLPISFLFQPLLISSTNKAHSSGLHHFPPLFKTPSSPPSSRPPRPLP